jgi:protein-disulfide isomerase/uncharacterized membrane protein
MIKHIKFLKKNNDVKPLPFFIYFIAVIFLSFSGILVSLYLSFSHYKVYTDITYKSFCAISSAINCDTVSQSPYSIFFHVPVPIWGIMGYCFFFLLVTLGEKGESTQARMWSIPFVVAMLFSSYSVVLAFISSYYIKAYCILCIISYGVNLLLAYFTWLITRRFSHKHFFSRIKDDIEYLKYRKKQTAVLLGCFMLVAAALPFVFPAYWNIASVDSAVDIPKGITKEGHPWIGSPAPSLEIVEYSDYQCFQCKKMHFLLRQLVADNPDTIRIVHRNYPMDHQFNPIVKEPFHRGSGKMALLAIYAASKGKFWQMNDHLYKLVGSKKNIRVEAVAEALDLDYQELARALNSRRLRHQLQKDIFSGIKLGISGTPAYVVDGKVYLGQIPAELLKSGMQN